MDSFDVPCALCFAYPTELMQPVGCSHKFCWPCMVWRTLEFDEFCCSECAKFSLYATFPNGDAVLLDPKFIRTKDKLQAEKHQAEKEKLREECLLCTSRCCTIGHPVGCEHRYCISCAFKTGAASTEQYRCSFCNQKTNFFYHPFLGYKRIPRKVETPMEAAWSEVRRWLEFHPTHTVFINEEGLPEIMEWYASDEEDEIEEEEEEEENDDPNDPDWVPRSSDAAQMVVVEEPVIEQAPEPEPTPGTSQEEDEVDMEIVAVFSRAYRRPNIDSEEDEEETRGEMASPIRRPVYNIDSDESDESEEDETEAKEKKKEEPEVIDLVSPEPMEADTVGVIKCEEEVQEIIEEPADKDGFITEDVYIVYMDDESSI